MAYTGEFVFFFSFCKISRYELFLLVFVTNCMKLVSAISFTSCLTKILLHEAYKIEVLHKNSPQVTEVNFTNIDIMVFRCVFMILPNI